MLALDWERVEAFGTAEKSPMDVDDLFTEQDDVDPFGMPATLRIDLLTTLRSEAHSGRRRPCDGHRTHSIRTAS